MKKLYILLIAVFSFLANANAQYLDPVLLHSYGGSDAKNAKVTAVADLDGDGHDDFVCGSSSAEGKVSIFYGNNSNGFDDRVDLIFNTDVLDLKIADIDDDGHLDIVVSIANGQQQFWFKNQESRSFTSLIMIAEGFTTAHVIEVVDFDDDGKLDILLTSTSSDLVALSKGLGNGMFEAPSVIISSIPGLHNIQVADLDGDGDIDIVPLSYTLEDFGWYKNNDSTLEWTIIDTAFVYARGGAVGDIDNDLDQDIVVYSYEYNQYRIYTNDSNGAFVLAKTINDALSNYIAIEDVNNDGKNDILSNSYSRIRFIEHNGSLNFESGIDMTSAVGGVKSYDFLNVNENGVDDLVVITGIALVWVDGDDLVDGNTQVTYNGINSSSSGGALSNEFLVMPNANGFADVMCVANPPNSNLNLFQKLENTENGDYSAATSFHIEDEMKSDGLIFYTELNNNNNEDILYNKTNTALGWIEKDNAGNFLQENVIQLDQTLINGLDMFDIGDIDNDGDTDILCRTRAISNGQYFLVALVNNGAGIFNSVVTIQTAVTSLTSAKFGDFDDDNDLDVVVGNGNSMRMFINNGSGNYPTSKSVSVPYRESTAPYDIQLKIADLDGDGDDEVFGNFKIEANDPFCTFHCGPTYYYIHVIFDFNGNNLVTNNVYNSFFHPTYMPFNTIYEDYNGDGNIDMLTAYNTNLLVWILGDGTGVFGNPVTVSDEVLYGFYVRPNFRVVDFDLDGDLDVITIIGNTSNARVELYENTQGGIIDNDNDGISAEEDCDDSDNTIAATLATPDIPKAISICEGELLSISVNNLNAGLSYVWSGPENYTSAETSLQINNINASQAGIYQVASYNDNCVSIIAQIEVTVLAVDDVTINFESDLLTVEGIFLSYQWQLEGDAIIGATAATYQPLESGNYSVIATNSDGCEATSNEIQVSINSLFTNQLDKGISIYPNPVSTQQFLNVKISTTRGTTGFYEIISINGGIVKKGTFRGNLTQVEIDNLARGMYTLKVYSNEQNWVSQFQVQ